MKKEESIAEAYLKTLGFKDVVFEPNGNIPPDFSIDNKIAVEVRRLNQNFITKDGGRGLEETQLPLFKLLRSSLSEFDSRYEGNSYWVFVTFWRPIEESATIRKSITKALAGFLKTPSSVPCDIKVASNICLSISVSEPIQGRVFRFGGGMDRDSGGFVLAEFKKNFDYCVKEKSEKIKSYYDKYSSWWLILVDRLAHEFSDRERKEIKSMISPNPCWGKVIVLNSENGNNILEI